MKTITKEAIERHAQRYAQRQDSRNFLNAYSKYNPYSSCFGLYDYCMEILQKKRLISESTRTLVCEIIGWYPHSKIAFEVLGDEYNEGEVYTLARKYYLMSGKPNLLKRIQEKKDKVVKDFEYSRESK